MMGGWGGGLDNYWLKHFSAISYWLKPLPKKALKKLYENLRVGVKFSLIIISKESDGGVWAKFC